MGFTSSKADPDLYYRAQVKKNGEKYYEYLLAYCVDYILCVSEDTKPIMDEVGRLYRVKENSVGPPKRYLGVESCR